MGQGPDRVGLEPLGILYPGIPGFLNQPFERGGGLGTENLPAHRFNVPAYLVEYGVELGVLACRR